MHRKRSACPLAAERSVVFTETAISEKHSGARCGPSYQALARLFLFEGAPCENGMCPVLWKGMGVRRAFRGRRAVLACRFCLVEGVDGEASEEFGWKSVDFLGMASPEK